MPTSESERGAAGDPISAAMSSSIREASRALKLPKPQLKRAQLIIGALVVVFSIWSIGDGGFKLFMQRAVNGLTNGAIYAAAGLALVLIFKATGVVNFAQGAMGTLGAFLAWSLMGGQKVSMPAWLALILAMVISAAVAAGIERVFIRPFDPSNHLPIVIVTLALSLVFEGFAASYFGPDQKRMRSIFPTGAKDFFTIFGARVRYAEVGIWAVLLIVVLLITLLLKRTKIGLAFRSVSSNLDSSRLVGVNVGRTLQFGWAIAAAVGTLGAYLYATTSSLEPTLMLKVLIYAFAAATLGGLDSIGGVIVGAVLIGLLQSMLGGYIKTIGSELSLTAAFVVMMLVLLVRPTGLFGSRTVERV